MTDPEILQLLAFAASPGGGNPAGVVLDASSLTAERMQRIAAELGHAETAFVTAREEPRRLRVRFFSPHAEVPFCGHATVATAVAFAQRHGAGTLTVETAAGPIRVETAQDAAGVVTAAFTSADPIVRPLDPVVLDRLLALLGLGRDDLDPRFPPRESFAGNRHPLLVLRARDAFDGFGFDPAAVRALMDEQGWAGTVTVVHVEEPSPEGVFTAEARNLFPVGAITEDPATGSAAAAFGAYLRDIRAVDPPARVVVRQGRHIGRPSILTVDVPATGGIVVRGSATPLED